MKASEFRDMTVDELAEKEKDMRKELFNLRFQRAKGEIENPMRIRVVRRDIARILTVRKEKESADKKAAK